MRIIYALLAYVFLSGGAYAQCLEPRLYDNAAGKIERYEKFGTMWYPDAVSAFTNAHVVNILRLSAQWWKWVNITHVDPRTRRDVVVPAEVRVVEYVGYKIHSDSAFIRSEALPGDRDIARLAFRGSIPQYAKQLAVETSLAKAGQMVYVPGYPDGRREWAHGKVQTVCAPGGGCDYGGMRLRLARRDNPYVMVQGASGSPVLNCKGNVIGMVWSSAFKEPMFGLSRVDDFVVNRGIHVLPSVSERSKMEVYAR